MSCSIASVTSYLSENEAKNLQNGDVRLAQIPDFEMGYLENHFYIGTEYMKSVNKFCPGSIDDLLNGLLGPY